MTPTAFVIGFSVVCGAILIYFVRLFRNDTKEEARIDARAVASHAEFNAYFRREGVELRRKEYEREMFRLRCRQPMVDDRLRRAWGVPELHLDRTFDDLLADIERRQGAST